MSAQCVCFSTAPGICRLLRANLIYTASRERRRADASPDIFFCFFRAPGNNNNTYLRPSHGFGE